MKTELIFILPLMATACYVASPQYNGQSTRLNAEEKNQKHMNAKQIDRDKVIKAAKMALNKNKISYTGIP